MKRLKIWRSWLSILGLSLCFGCATNSYSQLRRLDYSILDIQKGIKKALPVGFRSISQDGRRFESEPFVRYGSKLIPATVQAQRGKAYIEIRGVQRPYMVEVLVEIEEATQPGSIEKGYKVADTDDVVAKIFLARLKAYLQKSKRSGNVIDDFRVY